MYSESFDRRMLRLELADRRPGVRTRKRFMDTVKEDTGWKADDRLL